MVRAKLTQEFIEKELAKEGYKLIGKYVNSSTKMTLQDEEGYLYSITWSDYNHGYRNDKVSKYNPYSIDNIKLYIKLNNRNVELLSTEFINIKNKLLFKCLDCGNTFDMTWSCFKRNQNGCSCRDGISYPEKFIISILDQLRINYIREYKPTWNNDKRYDFYLEDYNCIIEANGEQHYIQTRRKEARTLQEEKENDQYKKQLALENNIKNYIELDCRKSNLEWIKQSILNSELSKIVDLNKIDWLKCEEFALSNRVKEVCDYWNNKKEWETTKDLSNKFNLNISTINRWLKQGVTLGWCNYNPEEENKKRNIKGAKSVSKKLSKPVEIFKNGKSLGIFYNCAELERQSEELFDIKLNKKLISAVCNGKRNHHKGFTFKHISQQEYNLRKSNLENFNIDVDRMIS